MSGSTAPPDALTPFVNERDLRKATMQMSNWVGAAPGGAREYIPVSSTPLDQAYLRSKSARRGENMARLASQSSSYARDKVAPASW